jgi:hypothetical protein
VPRAKWVEGVPLAEAHIVNLSDCQSCQSSCVCPARRAMDGYIITLSSAPSSSLPQHTTLSFHSPNVPSEPLMSRKSLSSATCPAPSLSRLHSAHIHIQFSTPSKNTSPSTDVLSPRLQKCECEMHVFKRGSKRMKRT